MRNGFVVASTVIGCLCPLFAGAQTLNLQSQYLNVSTTTQDSSLSSDIDLVVEGDTYVPSFYQGRAEPSAGNQMRVIAIAADHNAINYAWTVNGQRTSAVAGLPNVISFNAPLTNQVLVEVSASDSAGRVLGKTSRYIPLSEPRILFYEDNPLRGYSHNAIGRTFNLIGNETSVIVAPYFIGKNDEPPLLLPKWTLSRKEIATATWRRITLTKPEDTSRVYSVGFNLEHQTKLSLHANAFFNLNFGL